MRVLLLAAAVLLVAPACTSPCEELAEKVCACEASASSIDACERRASQKADELGDSARTEELCERLLDTCECSALDTTAGKRACGLAE